MQMRSPKEESVFTSVQDAEAELGAFLVILMGCKIFSR
jgi:hypothetical protein